MITSNLGVAFLLLLVAVSTALPQQQGGNRSQQPPKVAGDIDSIAPDTAFVSLEPESIQRFLNNEKSVNTLTRCYMNKAQCRSQSSINLMNQIGAIAASGGQCNNCDPAIQQKMEQLMSMLIKGLAQGYPQQWQHIFPHIRPLVLALQNKSS